MNQHGMVVAPQAPAVEAGVRVLMEGGNAADAAVTASFVQMVVDPQMCGVAGFGVANVLTADGTQLAIDFNGTAGSKATPEMWQDIVVEQDWTGYGYHLKGQVNDVGYGSIMTPGTVAGMAEVLRRFGTRSWSDALSPAVNVSREGFLVSPELWRMWNTPFGMLGSMRDRIQATEASREVFIKPDGSTKVPGERHFNPDYTRVLERLAEHGPEDFYHGELARQMAADLEANDAFVTQGDLASYKPDIMQPISVTYRGYEVITTPPASGGPCLAETLRILEHEDIAALGLNSVEYIDFVARAMQAAYHDWYRFVGDPEFVDVPLAWMLSDERAREWYEKIKRREPVTVPRYPEPRDTTNVTVVDAAGNVVVITHSLGASSGVTTTTGLGFQWNNIMNTANPVPGLPNSIAPGKSRITGMCPTIVRRDGEVVLALGAPGGTRIITGVLQTLLNVLDHGMSAVEAVSAPRFDLQFDILDCEARIPSWVKDELAARGFRLWPNPAHYGNFANVQAIVRDPATGSLSGGADPRYGGAVMSG